MNNYKVILFLLCFFSVISCKSDKDKENRFNSKASDLQESEIQKDVVRIDSIKLIQNKWKIKNVKKIKRNKIEASAYYKTFIGSHLVFDKQGRVKLNNDSIGLWNVEGVIIYKGDSLKGEYHFMEMGGVLQLISLENTYQEGDYFIINLQNSEFDSSNSNEKVNFDD